MNPPEVPSKDVSFFLKPSIMDIGSIGRNKARNIFNLISEKYFSDKYRIKNGLVPMDLVLEYFSIKLS